MKRSIFAERHPYWFVVLMELMVIIVYILAGAVAHFMKLSNLGLYGIANLGLSIIAAVIITGMGWWNVIGFRSPARNRDLIYFIVPFFPIVINLIPGVQISGINMLLEIFGITMMVGFVEESIFRGLMLNALKAHGYWKAAIITSLLFGLTHAMNLLAGKSVADDMAQIFYAVAIGFAFAALVLKKGIIWPLVLAHFLIDFFNFIQKTGFTFSPFWNLFIVLSIAVIFTAYGIFIMVQKDREKGLPQS
jgi:hypothetical protein